MRKPFDFADQMGEGEVSGEDVFEAVHSVMHRYRAEQYRAMHDSPSDLTHMDGKVLGFFARHPGATQKDLSAHSGRDKGQLARLISGLRERGLLEGRTDEADRRNIRLQLTAAGRSVQQTLQRRARKLSEQAVANMSPGEQRQIVALLMKLHANLQERDPAVDLRTSASGA